MYAVLKYTIDTSSHTFITTVSLCEISECPSPMVVVWRCPHEHRPVHWLTFTQNQFHEFLIWFDTLPLPPSAWFTGTGTVKTKQKVLLSKTVPNIISFICSILFIFLFYLSWWTKDDNDLLIKLLKFQMIAQLHNVMECSRF